MNQNPGELQTKLHRSRVRPAPLHLVEVQPHSLPPRWIVAPLSLELPAVSAEHACIEGVRAAHRRAGGVPPWLPLRRHSLQFTNASPVGTTVPIQGALWPPDSFTVAA